LTEMKNNAPFCIDCNDGWEFE